MLITASAAIVLTIRAAKNGMIGWCFMEAVPRIRPMLVITALASRDIGACQASFLEHLGKEPATAKVSTAKINLPQMSKELQKSEHAASVPEAWAQAKLTIMRSGKNLPMPAYARSTTFSLLKTRAEMAFNAFMY